MSSVSLEIFPPSIEKIVATIGSLPDRAYDVLREEVEGDSAFDTDKERCERLATALELSPEQVGLLLTALELLYGRMKTLPQGAQVAEVIRRFIDGFDEVKLTPELHEKLQVRLAELTTPKERVELAQKIRRLRTGFLNNATGFSTFVDLRPDFSPEYDRVRALVPIIQLMISTDAQNVAEQHAVFQLDEKGLAGLKAVVAKAEKKLETLRTKGVEKLDIIFQKVRR